MVYRSLAIILTVSGVLGCADPTDTPDNSAPVVTTDVDPPAPAVLPRLTATQYKIALLDLFGHDIVPPSAVEPDAESGGLIAVGATVASISPRGVEQYFEGARAVAAQLVAEQKRSRIATCDPANNACVTDTIRAQGRRIWRRPLTDTEVAEVEAVALAARESVGQPWAAMEYALVMLLSSPHFLYRAELGNNGWYTDYEMASRLSFYLWNTTPDAALLDAAEAGELTTDAGLATHVDRLLASDRARVGVRTFFSQLLELHKLDEIDKDPTVFLHFSSDLPEMAREETLRLIEWLVFEQDADYRDLFLTRTTFVNRRLASIYNIPAPKDEGFGMVNLPEYEPRRGVLGHVSFLALQSHPVGTSATLRGLFIREKLLCGVVPSPPTELNTAIPEPGPEAITLKQRLLVHMEDPACGGCHSLVDPIGFGLENFDGLGRYRVMDSTATIDPSGELDGEPFDDFGDLAERIANHRDFTSCFVEHAYAYANGHQRTTGERDLVSDLTDQFVADGLRVKPLLRLIALSNGFRKVGEVQ